MTDRILGELTNLIRMNDRVEQMEVMMREPQRCLQSPNARMIRLETVLELALRREVPSISGADDS